MGKWLAGVGALIAVLMLTGAAPLVRTQAPDCSPGLHTGFVNGRSYLVYVPESARMPAPTIVTYHGRLQTALSQIRGTGLQDVADREGVALIAPQARAGEWDFRGSDTRFTNRILDGWVCDDPARTYASGMSMGSAMTFLQACAQPRRFAAFGGVGFEIYLPKCADPDPVSIIALHGTADSIVPFAGGRTASSATAPSARIAMRQWARRDGCQQYVREVYVPGVAVQTWNKCREGTQVKFYTLYGGKHVWPNNDRVDAAELMWSFFNQYRLTP